jgi:hypothetical protein
MRVGDKTKILITMTVLVGVVNAAVASVWRGTVEQQIVAMAAPFWVGLPFGLLALLLFGIAPPGSWGRLRRIAGALLVVVVLAVTLPLSVFLGGYLQQQDIVAAKGYCERLVPLLEKHREVLGSYPTRLEDLQPAPPPVPRHLRHRDFYRSNGTYFDFFVVNYGSFMEYYTYDSVRKEWRTWT